MRPEDSVKWNSLLWKQLSLFKPPRAESKSRLAVVPPHPARHPALPQPPSVCAQGQDTIHILLKQRCWEVNPEVNPGPLHTGDVLPLQCPSSRWAQIYPQGLPAGASKPSQALVPPPHLQGWGTVTFLSLTRTALRHSWLPKPLGSPLCGVFHSTSTAEFLQHLQVLQGPAKTHLYLFREENSLAKHHFANL